MSGEVSFSEFEFRSTAYAQMCERAEKAEAALEKAKGIMTTLAEEGAKTEALLGQYRRTLKEVSPLIDMIAALPEKPGVTRVRALRSTAARVRTFLTWLGE
jgi:hypothetical protein